MTHRLATLALAAALHATAPGARLLARRGRVRTKVVVSLLPRSRPLKVLMRSARL